MAYLVLVEWYPWAGSADFLKEPTYLDNQHGSMSLPIVIHRAKKEIIDLIIMGHQWFPKTLINRRTSGISG